MKCDRCKGLRYIERADGKCRPCSKCGGRRIAQKRRVEIVDTTDRLLLGVNQDGFEFNFEFGTWAETDATGDAWRYGDIMAGVVPGSAEGLQMASAEISANSTTNRAK